MGKRLPSIPRRHSRCQFATLRSELYSWGTYPRVNAHVQGRGRRSRWKLEHKRAFGFCNPSSDRDLDKPAPFHYGMVDGTLVSGNAHGGLSSIGSRGYIPSSQKEPLNLDPQEDSPGMSPLSLNPIIHRVIVFDPRQSISQFSALQHCVSLTLLRISRDSLR